MGVMYLLGDLVAYGVHGVCRITDLEEKRVDKKVITYFVLEPVQQPGAKYYIPQGNAVALAKIRPLLDRQVAQSMLSDQSNRCEWISEDNRRKLRYREIINGVDAAELIGMMRALYLFRNEQQAAGRRLHQCDEGFLHDAEKILSSEVALVLDMPCQDALEYIRKALSE